MKNTSWENKWIIRISNIIKENNRIKVVKNG